MGRESGAFLLPPFARSHIISTVTSPGLMPGMRLAWPRLGALGVQLLPGLDAQAGHVQVVRVRGQGRVLHLQEALAVGLLAADVALVFDVDLQLLHHVGGVVRQLGVLSRRAA